MKKLISLALAIVMIMCLSTTAFATTANNTGDYTAEVTGSYVPGNESNGIVYCVDIEWEDLDFTYHAEKGAVWDPDTLTYSEVEPAYWEGEGTITVTNRSNTKITATPSYQAAEGYENAGMDFSTNKLKVASPVESKTAQFGTITVTPNGFLPAMDEADTIGTITLNIAQDNDVTLAEAEALYVNMCNLDSNWRSMEGSYDDPEYQEFSNATLTFEAVLNACRAGSMPQENLNNYYSDALAAYNTAYAKVEAMK